MIKKLSKAFKRSFIKRIMALIFLFNVLFVVLFIGMTYFTTQNNVESIMGQKLGNVADSANNAAENYFNLIRVPIRMIEADKDIQAFFEGRSESEDAAAQILRSAAESNMGITEMWCISEISGRLLVPGDARDISIDGSFKWYSEAEMSSASGLRVYLKDDNYASPVDSTVQMIAVSPVRVNGEFAGCVGLEFSSSELTDLLKNSVNPDEGYAVMLDSSGTIVCTTDDGGNLSEHMNKLGYTLNEIISETGGMDVSVIKGSSGSDKSFVTVRNISNGWKLAVLFDGREADSEFAKLYLQQLLVLVCLFALELIATLNVIRHEAKDIPEISSSIAEISAGNYNFRINSSSENEIGLIANSVDNLAETLQEKNKLIDDYTSLDPTTKLQNRYKMYEYIDDLIVSCDESRPRFALFFIDIDNFKWITETLGHRHGDEFLQIFAQRLKNAAPKLFRFSGDEFVVLTPFDSNYDMLEEMVDNMRHEFEEPIEILGDKLYAHFSVGISIFPDDDTDPDLLLRDADIAMERAKEKGKGRLSYYNAALHQKVLSKATISQKLNKALENNELFLNFQPIISVSNGDIHGFEVLLRWESDELGSVPPSTFVQIAEETGAIIDIGTWIFETACRYLKQMNEFNKDIIMSINVSPIQLKKNDFLEKIKRTIDVFGINPANLQVEITETCLVDFMDKNIDFIRQMADMGISLALDDFGTGYSSFGYLKDMPIKCLKVDKSFVDEITNKNKDYQITGSIIDMVRNLGIKTVVEGVENIEQYNILREMKCDYIQGFLMSKPLNANDAMEFVMKYDELHKPNKKSLQESSKKLAAEKRKKKESINK
ncbi:MAG: EAL domain-containing protein [Huintestinicola sp.]